MTTKEKITEMLKDYEPGDLFTEVRQRVAAFQYFQEYWKNKYYGELDESQYLDEAYRFLYGTCDPDFIIFCAKKENMDPVDYVNMLVMDMV